VLPGQSAPRTMDRLLARLERRLGRFAIPNLIVFVVGGMVIAWVLSQVRQDFVESLVLDMSAVRRGQVWRLVSFLFIPMGGSAIWFFVNVYFTWWVGSSLEQHWGAFRFNLCYLLGTVGTIVAAIVAGPQSNTWLDASIFLAFATVFPDVSILLFFILPVKVKWLGIAAALGIAFAAATGDWGTRAAIGAALVNYGVFFGGHWAQWWRMRNVAVRQKARRVTLQSSAGTAFGERVCAVCGAREADGADIRVCSCAKCGGQPRTLCLEHARDH
jgi:hypothetical protein